MKESELLDNHSLQDNSTLIDFFREGIRLHKDRLMSGTVGISVAATLLTSGILGPVITQGATTPVLLQLLTSLGANAVAGWLGDWSARKAGAFLQGVERDTDKLLEEMARDLEESLATDVTLSDEIGHLLVSTEALSVALETLQTSADNQTALLDRLRREIPNYSGQLAELLSRELSVNEQRLSSKLDSLQDRMLTVQRANAPLVNAEEYFKPLLDAGDLFNHTWTLVGREAFLEELHTFVQSPQMRVAVLTGRGGIGKSKLLHAFSLTFNQHHPEQHLRFVLENANLDRLDAMDIPEGDCVIILDDAHRYEDLGALITFAQRRPYLTKLIFSIRPKGRDRLNVALGEGFYDQRKVMWLPELSALLTEQVKALAAQVLGDEYEHLAQGLATLSKDCPLITVIGGQLLVEKSVSPSLLERDEEFRTLILRKFSEEILGRLSDYIEPATCKALLRMLSGVAPFPIADADAVTAAAEFLGIDSIDLNSYIGTLERAGAVLRRGSGIRIVPDVLSDYILYDACFSAGRPTGYAEKLYKGFITICPSQVLLSLAELDWRVQKSNSAQVQILDSMWNHIQKDFQETTPNGRARWLGLLKDAAYFQPKRVLGLVTIALADVPEDQLGIASPEANEFGRILDTIPMLLHHIAHTKEYTRRCLDLLWRLGKNSNRLISGDMRTVLQILQELASYDPNKPAWIHQYILDAAEQWLVDERSQEYLNHPLDVIEPLFAKSGHTEYSEGNRLVMSMFFVLRENTLPERRCALQLVVRCASSSSIRVAVRAVEVLTNATNEPVAWFGSSIPDEECDKWIPDDLEVLEHLGILMSSTTHPILHMQIWEGVRWHVTHARSQSIRDMAAQVVSRIPFTLEFRVVKALLYPYAENWHLEEENANASWSERWLYKQRLWSTLAAELVDKYPAPADGFKLLSGYIEDAFLARLRPEPNAHLFLSHLAAAQPEYAKHLCVLLIAQPSNLLAAHFWSLLPGVRALEPKMAAQLAAEAVQTGDPVLCRATAQSFSQILGVTVPTSTDFTLLEQLVQHSDAIVRKLALQSLASLGRLYPREALDVIAHANIDSASIVAEAVCDAFESISEADSNAITDIDVVTVLEKLRHLPNLDAHRINDFLVAASFRAPEAVFALLFWRVKENASFERADYHALPFEGFHEKLEGLSQSPSYKDFLRGIRDAALAEKHGFGYLAPELFREISLNYSSPGLAVLREWLDSNDQDKLKCISNLLSEAPASFVFENEQLVTELLTSATTCGEECLSAVVSNLYHSAAGGIRSGIPGEPFPEDVRLRDGAAAALADQNTNSPGYRFYGLLYERAQQRIEQERASGVALYD